MEQKHNYRAPKSKGPKEVAGGLSQLGLGGQLYRAIILHDGRIISLLGRRLDKTDSVRAACGDPSCTANAKILADIDTEHKVLQRCLSSYPGWVGNWGIKPKEKERTELARWEQRVAVRVGRFERRLTQFIEKGLGSPELMDRFGSNRHQRLVQDFQEKDLEKDNIIADLRARLARYTGAKTGSSAQDGDIIASTNKLLTTDAHEDSHVDLKNNLWQKSDPFSQPRPPLREQDLETNTLRSDQNEVQASKANLVPDSRVVVRLPKDGIAIHGVDLKHLDNSNVKEDTLHNPKHTNHEDYSLRVEDLTLEEQVQEFFDRCLGDYGLFLKASASKRKAKEEISRIEPPTSRSKQSQRLTASDMMPPDSPATTEYAQRKDQRLMLPTTPGTLLQAPSTAQQPIDNPSAVKDHRLRQSSCTPSNKDKSGGGPDPGGLTCGDMPEVRAVNHRVPDQAGCGFHLQSVTPTEPRGNSYQADFSHRYRVPMDEDRLRIVSQSRGAGAPNIGQLSQASRTVAHSQVPSSSFAPGFIFDEFHTTGSSSKRKYGDSDESGNESSQKRLRRTSPPKLNPDENRTSAGKSSQANGAETEQSAQGHRGPSSQRARGGVLEGYRRADINEKVM